MSELPNIVYGRLLEAAHISGYGFERMADELVDLLDGDRWQQVGPGYANVNDFLRSIDLSKFDLGDKAELHRRIKTLQPDATVRAIGAATGTSKSAVNDHVRDRTRRPEPASSEQGGPPEPVQPRTPEPEPAPHVTRNSGNDEWYTPPEYIHAARDVLGGIDLDPASSPAANDTVKADRYYTVDDNGLARPWAGRVWMNPPYSTGLVDKFVFRMIDAYQSGDVKAAVVLTNNATDTKWWQALARRSAAVCMLAGRIRFRGPDGAVAGAGLQGQTITLLGDDRDRFLERFAEFGVVL